MEKVKESSYPSRKDEKELAEKRDVIRAAASLSSENIIASLISLKLEIMKSLDQMNEQLMDKQKTFADLEKAIACETKHLEEFHDIRVEANSLAALIQANKEKKAKFEHEMGEAKASLEEDLRDKEASFKRQQDLQKLEAKEAHEKLSKERERENEEYQYKLKLDRQRDNDVYESKKQALLHELAEKSSALKKACVEREAHLKARESELEDLRTREGISSWALFKSSASVNRLTH